MLGDTFMGQLFRDSFYLFESMKDKKNLKTKTCECSLGLILMDY